jgi:hypothetical protein
MAGEVSIKTFEGGMNKDLDFSLVKENQYYDAQNFKLIANKESNSFVLENAEGNALWLNLSGVGSLDDTYYLVGHCYIQPYLVLFYTTNHADRTPDAGDTSVIVRVTIDKDEPQQAVVIYTDGVSSTKLNFSDTYPISAVGHYESSDNIKVYWTDGYNNVRWMNIMDENLATYTADMFDLIPDFPWDGSTSLRPIFSEYISGDIVSSTVQYAFQYYIETGASTLWSPASKLIQVPVLDSLDGSKMIGGALDESTPYGVGIDISVPSSNLFNMIRVVRIEYETYNGTPTVSICSEQEINPGQEYNLRINDTGTTLSELVYEEFLIQSNGIFSAKALAIKDNYLFAGNVREGVFDVDLDCRAYRYPSSRTTRVYESNLTDYYDIDQNGDWSTSLSGDTGSNWSIPETADCINKYNKSNATATDDEYTNEYMYQSDGTTLGAEGANVTINFITPAGSSEEIDTYGDTNDSTWNAGESLYVPGERSFHRNEVYRIGLVFRNEKMQASPVKWVCDLKMPTYFEASAYNLTYTSAGSVYRVRLGFSVSLSASLSTIGATSWEIVCVPREPSDRSILGQGILQSSEYDSNLDYYFTTPHITPESAPGKPIAGNLSYESNVMRFISPEVAFNKNLEFKEDDFFHYTGYYDWVTANNQSTATGIVYGKLLNFTGLGTWHSDYKAAIIDGQVVGYTTDEGYRVSINGYSYSPFSTLEPDGATGRDGGPNTTHFICAFASDFPSNFPTVSDTRAAVVNYKRDVFTSQYGGITYEDRQNNTYISISDPKASSSESTYEGDTFIDWFSYLNVCNGIDETYTETEASMFLFPCETSISLGHRLDDGIWRNVGDINSRLIQEISGSWSSDCIDNTARRWEQDIALYQYNPVYSQLNKASLYLADNGSEYNAIEYPIRIKRSEHKINGETKDSFTEFLPNNYIDLNGQHGPLNNLEIFQNNLYFWQNSGFGVASVNTRSLIQDNSPGILALGTGGILDRVDYISDTIGNQNQFGIAKSIGGLYWVDNNKNEFFKFSKGLGSVSKLGGIQTWINDNGRIGDAKLIYDHKYNDIIFTITFSRVGVAITNSGDYITTCSCSTTGLDAAHNGKLIARYDSGEIIPINRAFTPSGGSVGLGTPYPFGQLTVPSTQFYLTFDKDSVNTYTVVYNELVDAFTSFASYKPGRYIKLDTNFLSTNDYHDLYKHNGDDAYRSTYYTTEYDSSVTLIFNKDYPYSKVWDALKWHSESDNGNGVNQFEDTFDTVTISNDYQHTGDRDLYYAKKPVEDSPPVTRPTEIVRRDRTWSMQIPRNIVDVNVSTNSDITLSGNWDETQLYKERIRDKYIKCYFTYDNSNYMTFSVPFISAIYRKSER